MTHSSVREYGDLTHDEVELAYVTVQRRIAGLFYCARHPKLRNEKGNRKGTRGQVFVRTRDDKWLEDYAMREVFAEHGFLRNPRIKRIIIRRVLRDLKEWKVLYYHEGAWHLQEEFMSARQAESQLIRQQNRQQKLKERHGNGYVRQPRRSRRPALAAA